MAGRRDIDHTSTLHLQVHCPELLAATGGESWGSVAPEVGWLWQVSAVISLPLFSGRDERGGGPETLSTPHLCPTPPPQLDTGVSGGS